MKHTLIITNWKQPKTVKIVFPLTIEEGNMLCKLADRSKMDCWFYVDFYNATGIIIRDRENRNRIMSTRNAIKLLDDGMTDIHDYYLTDEEIAIWDNLILRVRHGK